MPESKPESKDKDSHPEHPGHLIVGIGASAGGYLVLGSSETNGNFLDLFTSVSEKGRLYKAKLS